MDDQARPTTGFWARLAPTRLTGWIHVIAWLNFVANVVIIATGGAVRLTDSGLGCPTWPTCTATSLVPTHALSWHSLVEFGNRMMSPVLGILALLLLIAVWRLRNDRRILFVLAWIVMAGILAQAVVGGFTVRTGLNPGLVAFHYLVSSVLVCVMAAFLMLKDTAPGPRTRVVPSWYAIATHVTTLVLAVTLIFGVTTSASGPYSGDVNVSRHGIDASLMAHIHSIPAYVLLALTLLLVVAAALRRLPTLRWSIVLLCAEAVQIAVGIYQSNSGLPPLSVGVHMVLAALTAAAMTVLVLRLKAAPGSTMNA